MTTGPIAARAGPAASRGAQRNSPRSARPARTWWTLGFEATGPADLLRSELQATAALVFSHALPGRPAPGPDESRSYAEWLYRPSDAENNADS